jgi:hypothetical protein
MAAVIKKSHP